jgi:hypothetical protein
MSTSPRMNLTIWLTTVVWAIAMLFGAGGAEAATVDFTITGTYQGPITFTLPSNPTPAGYDPGVYFYVFVEVTPLSGGGSLSDIVYFYPSSSGEELYDADGYFLITGAPQLYTGSEASPSFDTGDFSGLNTASDAVDHDASIDITSATPLPSTWLMLLSGFLSLGFFACRGTNKNVVAVAAA